MSPQAKIRWYKFGETIVGALGGFFGIFFICLFVMFIFMLCSVVSQDSWATMWSKLLSTILLTSITGTIAFAFIIWASNFESKIKISKTTTMPTLDPMQ